MMKPLSLVYWRRFVAKEWLPLLISLILAVMLWSFVGGEKTVDKSVMIPVEVINLPRHLVISNQFKKEIEVTVNGPRSLILELDNRKITRQIDLSKATPGTTVVHNDVESISIPRGITVLRVQPNSIILSLDKLIQKQFRINPVTTGNLPAGYILKDLSMDPELIPITGPETVLAAHEVLRTKVINLNGLRKSVQQQVPLDLDPAIVDLIGETTITAEISVGYETVQRELSVKFSEPVQNGTEELTEVKVLANVPKLLLESKESISNDLKAIVNDDEENSIAIIEIVPSMVLEYPIEIISISPAIIERPALPLQESTETTPESSVQ